MDNRPRHYTKLDMYNYGLKTENDEITEIIIEVSSMSAVDIADISSEITATDGNIYVEGHYFEFLNMFVEKTPVNTQLHILVSEI